MERALRRLADAVSASCDPASTQVAAEHLLITFDSNVAHAVVGSGLDGGVSQATLSSTALAAGESPGTSGSMRTKREAPDALFAALDAVRKEFKDKQRLLGQSGVVRFPLASPSDACRPGAPVRRSELKRVVETCINRWLVRTKCVCFSIISITRTSTVGTVGVLWVQFVSNACS
jgi:hypothetical protein